MYVNVSKLANMLSVLATVVSFCTLGVSIIIYP